MSIESPGLTIAKKMGLVGPSPDDATMTFQARIPSPSPAPSDPGTTPPLDSAPQSPNAGGIKPDTLPAGPSLGIEPFKPTPGKLIPVPETVEDEPILMAGLSSELAELALKTLGATKKLAGESLLTDEFVANVRVGQRTPVEGLTGRDLNLANIEGGDDIDTLIEQVSEVFREPIKKARRGKDISKGVDDPAKIAVQTNKATIEMANALDMPLDTIFKRRTGEVWNAEEITAARMIHSAIADETAELAKLVNQGLAGEDGMVRVKRNILIMATVQAQIKGAGTELARGLQAMRISAAPGVLRSAQIEDIIQATGGQDVNSAMVAAISDLVDRGGDVEKALAKFAAKAARADSTDIILEAWKGGLLSGPPTHMVNIGANALVQVLLAGERGIAATGRSIYNLGRKTVGLDNADGVSWDEAWTFMGGQIFGFADGLRAAAKTLRTGQPSDSATKFGMVHVDRGGAITGDNVYNAAIGFPARLLNKGASALGADRLMKPINSITGKMVDVLGEYYFRLPFRFLQAGDELFKVMTFQGEINAQIVRAIREKKLTGMEALEFRRQALNNPEEHIPEGLIQARELSREATFSTRPGQKDSAAFFQRFLNSKAIKPVGGTIVPFFGVMNNILKFTANRTPLKYFDFWRFSPGATETPNIQKLIGPDPIIRDMEVAKLISGTMLMATGTTMVWGSLDAVGLEGVRFRGQIKGSPKQRRVSRMVGRQGNAIFVPWSRLDPNNVMKGVLHDGKDRTYDIRRMDPVSTFVSFSGMIAEMMRYTETNEEREFIGFAAGLAFKDTVMDKSWMTGVSQFFAAWGDSGTAEQQAGKIERWAGQYAASWVPQWIKRWEQEKDPGITDTRPTNPYDTPGGRLLSKMANSMCAKWPGCNKDLPQLVNALGDDIEVRGAVGIDYMSPVYTDEPIFNQKDMLDAGIPAFVVNRPTFEGVRAGPGGDISARQLKEFIRVGGIESELERVGMPFSIPFRKLKGVALTPMLWREMMKTEGPVIREELTDLMKQDFYLEAPEGEGLEGSKQDLIKAVVREVRDEVREKMLATSPNFQEIREALALRDYVSEKGHFPPGSHVFNLLDGGQVRAQEFIPEGTEGGTVSPDRAVEQTLKRNFEK